MSTRNQRVAIIDLMISNAQGAMSDLQMVIDDLIDAVMTQFDEIWMDFWFKFIDI